MEISKNVVLGMKNGSFCLVDAIGTIKIEGEGEYELVLHRKFKGKKLGRLKVSDIESFIKKVAYEEVDEEGDTL